MNKQQLASKIWASANKLRSKIEANEYKDYILGFIFYKFLSDKEEETLKKEGWTDEDLPELKEEDTEALAFCQNNLGYFISYDNLFSTWLRMGAEFSVANVRDALNAFARLINKDYKKVFGKIFDTLSTGLSKLGESSGSQTKAISDLLNLIKDIPTDDSQDYDVLGFIYEYLIGNFAANAGKKAGEFYTPHEVALLMAEIVADHLKDRKQIMIYDPTSGSGSLLINIGRAVAKYIGNKDHVKYYAQEWKENTYNLTRMNLIMRGIKPDNIEARNGDTLEDDWPFFDEEHEYEALYVDAVVSNPPYSQGWNPKGKESDPRYARFGLAPKAKADYAFLLHDLYHIKPDGIMTIVLPHGVLFRGGDDGIIRKNLVEQNHIDTIIGLPGNLFFGTGIATIIMVLKQRRDNEDILIVDASKGFARDVKNNKLRACDIKRISDTVINRWDIDKYSRKVSREEVRKNGYNLNIARYVDSSEPLEPWDVYSTIYGGIPNSEIDSFDKYWNAFPTLKSQLFAPIEGTPTSRIIPSDVYLAISNNENVTALKEQFTNAFNDFPRYLNEEVILRTTEISIPKEKEIISENIFSRLRGIALIDRYDAYQILDDNWQTISTDLEMIQTEGFEATKKVDPNMVTKKKDGKEVEVQEGWLGHIIPFELVQSTLLSIDKKAIEEKQEELSAIQARLSALIDELEEDDRETLLNEDGDAFVPASVTAKLKNILEDVMTPELAEWVDYLELLNRKAGKNEKLLFMKKAQFIIKSNVATNKDGTYGKSPVTSRIAEIRKAYVFPDGTLEATVSEADYCISKEKELKSEIKEMAASLHEKTKATIENLDKEGVLELLRKKWLDPLCSALDALPELIIDGVGTSIEKLAEKYAVSMLELDSTISEAEDGLNGLLNRLSGDEDNMKAIREFQKILKGEANG